MCAPGEPRSSKARCRPEIEPLQVEINALIVAGQDIIERARTQVGNLAHALKTPLAVITNEAREDKSALGAKIAEQATIMRDQMNHYLDRARVAARVGVIGRVTQVQSVVEPSCARSSASIAIATSASPFIATRTPASAASARTSRRCSGTCATTPASGPSAR